MTTAKAAPLTIKAGTQPARLLNALADGRWVSLNEIHRRAGMMVVNSVVSRLRKDGFEIEHRIVKGKEKASLRHQYRLLNPPKKLPDPGTMPRDDLDRDATPRTKDSRYRIYIVNEANELILMATAPTPSKVGVEICRLGREGKIDRACLGILDTLGIDAKIVKGQWLVNPFDAKIT